MITDCQITMITDYRLPITRLKKKIKSNIKQNKDITSNIRATEYHIDSDIIPFHIHTTEYQHRFSYHSIYEQQN